MSVARRDQVTAILPTPSPVPILDRIAPDLARRLPRETWDALMLAVASVAAAAFGLTDLWNVFRIVPEPLSPWWSLAFALPGCVFVALRTRMPLTSLMAATALFAADLVTVGGIGSLLVLLDVLWHAVHSASNAVRRGIAAAIVIATGGVVVAALVGTGGEGRIAILMGIVVGSVLGTDYWWAVAVRQAEEVSLLESRRLADAARDTIRDERELMARELHDVVAGHVSALAIRAEAALSVEPDEERDRAALRAVRDAGLDAHEALRSMISVLRDDGGALAPPPRLADIPELLRQGEKAGLRVRSHDRLVGAVDEQVEHAATSTVREALANAARHAAGAEVDVTLHGDDDVVTVTIDSRGGRGAQHPTLSGSGTGLAALADRVGALGGDFHAGPRVDGWRVRARIPREAKA